MYCVIIDGKNSTTDIREFSTHKEAHTYYGNFIDKIESESILQNILNRIYICEVKDFKKLGE